MGVHVAAPAALAHHDTREVEVKSLANARLDAAIGGAAADDDNVAPQHVQQLGHARPVERARPALEENIILGPRRDLVGEAGLCRALDSVVRDGTPVSTERSVGSMTTSAPSARLTGVVQITGTPAARAAAIICTQASSTGRIVARRAGSEGTSARRQTS
jgi:hypothetical protein